VQPLLFLVPLALLFLGVPIYAALIIGSALIVALHPTLPLTQLHSTLIGSVDKFALLAIPLFLFAGEIMGRGGMSRRLIDWVTALTGGVRNELPLATVGAGTVFGAISGASAATVAAMGRLVYKPLLERGYQHSFVAGLLVCTAAIDIVIPPSVNMILYGATAEQSVADLFIAGILPGLLMAAVLAVYVVFFVEDPTSGRKRNFKLRHALEATVRAGWALGAPLIILGGIYAGVFSPTEAAGAACLYAVIVTVFIYRELSLRELWSIAVASMYNTAQVMLVVAAAGVFAWLITISGLPQDAVSFVKSLGLERWTVLLCINILLLIVGCLIDPGSAILILTPLLVPLVSALDVNLIHFGIIMTVNLAIGLFTPPFGINIFVLQAVFKTPLRVVYAGLLPFVLVDIVALMVVTYVPWLSLALLGRG
jgi:C4-dicarboxylate transporter DctM subunit